MTTSKEKNYKEIKTTKVESIDEAIKLIDEITNEQMSKDAATVQVPEWVDEAVKKAIVKKTQKPRSKGLGDTVEKVLKATGIATVAKFVLGEDCGCDERKQKLNALFPYVKPECLTEDEYNFLTEWFAVHRNSVRPSEQREILKIYNRTFKQTQEPTGCATCLQDIIDKLKKIYANYKD